MHLYAFVIYSWWFLLQIKICTVFEMENYMLWTRGVKYAKNDCNHKRVNESLRAEIVLNAIYWFHFVAVHTRQDAFHFMGILIEIKRTMLNLFIGFPRNFNHFWFISFHKFIYFTLNGGWAIEWSVLFKFTIRVNGSLFFLRKGIDVWFFKRILCRILKKSFVIKMNDFIWNIEPFSYEIRLDRNHTKTTN